MKRAYFHFQSKIWHHSRVLRARFLIKRENSNNFCTFNAVIGLLLIFTCILRISSPKSFLGAKWVKGGVMFTSNKLVFTFGVFKSINKCERESARRRTPRQRQTGFIICPMLYATARLMRQIINTKYTAYKQGVARTGRNTTGSPCSVGRPTAHASGGPAGPTVGSVTTRVPTLPAAGRPVHRQRYRRRPTTDDDRRQPAKQYWPIRRAGNNLYTDFKYAIAYCVNLLSTLEDMPFKKTKYNFSDDAQTKTDADKGSMTTSWLLWTGPGNDVCITSSESSAVYISAPVLWSRRGFCCYIMQAAFSHRQAGWSREVRHHVMWFQKLKTPILLLEAARRFDKFQGHWLPCMFGV